MPGIPDDPNLLVTEKENQGHWIPADGETETHTICTIDAHRHRGHRGGGNICQLTAPRPRPGAETQICSPSLSSVPSLWDHMPPGNPVLATYRVLSVLVPTFKSRF